MFEFLYIATLLTSDVDQRSEVFTIGFGNVMVCVEDIQTKLRSERLSHSVVYTDDRIESHIDKKSVIRCSVVYVSEEMKNLKQQWATEEIQAQAKEIVKLKNYNLDLAKEIAKISLQLKDAKLRDQENQVTIAKIAEENRKADLESAQTAVEAGIEVGEFFTATEFLAMDDEERARIGKLIGNLDSTYLPADQYGPTRIKSLSMYDDKNADRAAYMYFTTENWGRSGGEICVGK